MKELYWISVLGTLDIIMAVVFAFALMIFIVSGIFAIATKDDMFSEDDCRYAKRIVKLTIPVLIVSAILTVFIPSKKELYGIYGIGTIIDYVQDNPKAQELPDKTIEMLNVMADKYIENNKKEDQ